MDIELKTYNQKINGRRIGIVHVLGSVKAFKILAERYRNRGKKLGLRFNLIAGIYNLELSKKMTYERALIKNMKFPLRFILCRTYALTDSKKY